MFPASLALGLVIATSGVGALDSLLMHVPADSVAAPLRRFESEHGRFREGAEAALALGRLHFARGEYRQAADAFARAAARLDPARKYEARYWAGLSWLGLREPAQARATLEEVARSDSPRRDDAVLGVALAWEQSGRPDRALDVLQTLAGRDDLGEAGPAALERLIALGERQHRPDVAQRARVRLLRDYPASIEAARAGTPAVTAAAASASSARRFAVQIGSFTSAPRAQSLRNVARDRGFGEATVVSSGEGRTRVHVVRIGVYPNREDARLAGERAARALGVTYVLSPAP
jgi:tetratricopeptide (TPR) repeat protein